MTAQEETGKPRSHPFRTHVATLGGSTAIAQGLLLVASPLVTRLYSPGDMGNFGLFASFLGFASAAAGLRYEFGIISAKEHVEADDLLLLSLLLTLPVALASAALQAVLIATNSLSFGTLPLATIGLTAGALVVTGAFASGRLWNARAARYGDVAGSLIQQGIGRAALPLLAGFAGAGWSGLALGEFAGRALGVRRVLRPAWPAIAAAWQRSSAKSLLLLLRRHQRQATLNLPSSLLDALAVAIPVPLVAVAYGPAAAGQLLLAQRLVSAPLALIGNSVADVFHAEAARQHLLGDASLRPLVERVARKLLLIGVAGYGPAAILAPVVFASLFGAAWGKTGVVFAALTPAAIAMLVVSPLSRLLIVAGRMELKLVVDLVACLVPVATLLLPARFGVPYTSAVALFGAAQLVLLIGYYVVVWRAGGARTMAST